MTAVRFEDWERQRVERATGVLSTIAPDGGPHAAPVMIWFEGDNLRFETEPDSRKFKNLIRDPKVSICVFGQPKWAVVVRGRAEVLSPGTPGGGMEDQAQILVRPERKVSWRRKEG
ncbi:MAG TPA: pyridoxamine 5'-phosphate oxidase family protein [Actinomycetota bacterium]|nr:pyridoxamine 5'-phosphate oxidase family protein [Actinomycetota bacterium]